MAAIKDLHNPWRDAMLPATFRGVEFHVELDTRASGRRTVVHEYPKRDLPYSEDMGRAAIRFSFTGYLRNEKDSSTELHQWIRENYFRFRELELNLMLQGS